MKGLLEEEPTELLGLEEENDPTEIGFEDQDEEERPHWGILPEKLQSYKWHFSGFLLGKSQK